MIGTVLKYRYEIQEKISEGNLFTVYRCEDKIDNRMLAVKVLLPQYSSNRLFAQRLIVEAQAMVGISHPGIVEVFDCGEENDHYFMVTEYVRGLDLKERIRRSAPFTLSTAADVGLAISDVLDFAHKRGFVHGDLRPGNILVTAEGHIKLADFWVSAAVASAPSIRTNAMMRSVHYMAPEVAEGQAATPASDIYSLGIILYELLTASMPFDGDTPLAIALKHSKDSAPSIRALNPGVPKNLEALIARALQKDAPDRFRSAKSMLNELKSVRESLNLERPLVLPRLDLKKKPEEPVPTPVEDEEPMPPDEPDPALWYAVRKVLLIFVALAAVVLVVGIFFISRVPPEVRIPDLTGKTFDQARIMLERENVRVLVRTERYSEEYPEGTIYYQNPTAGRTIRAGKPVDVWLSKGSKYAVVPNLAGLMLEDARSRLMDLGLSVGEVSQEYSSVVSPGCVVRQMPAPGTKVERGRPVGLVYSLGPQAPVLPATPAVDDTAPQTPRSLDVEMTVPQGPQDQKVEIHVVDDNGENVAYSEVMHPGEKLKQTVTGVGSTIIIRVHIDGRLVQEVSR